MSDENVALVRRLTEEGFVGGKLEVVDKVVADDCVDHDPLPGQSQGREGQKQTCQMVIMGLSDRKALQDDFLSAGDFVIENWLLQGTHTGEFMGLSASRKLIQVRGIEIWRCAEGKIVERWGVIDTGAVMQQLQGPPAA